ncbi:CLUMA_CG009576, isoform A [Clunio marinus]|uniref:CLUMA_CG009576, isoform A n=1 Tax=Clunio marinus TaxID=568069 RepID=A0A1J1I8V3_9DIPT|nr:CLUMA_CG009576, isoform A [Clunio marinus]
MSKKNKVINLSELTLSTLANSIVSAVSYSIAKENIETNFNLTELDLSLVIVEINSYLEENGATHTIYEEILQLILSWDNLPAPIRFVCLQMLLNRSIKSLKTEVFPYPYYEKILQVVDMQGTNIKCLNLKGIWLKEDNMSLMFRIVKSLQNLVKLDIPYIATDDLLYHIMLYQKNLVHLDVSGVTDITDIGIEYLCRSSDVKQKLTVLDIGTLGEENICHEDIASLLTHIPNLKSLGSYSFVGRSIQYVIENINSDFVSKLEYLHDTETRHNAMNAMCKACPNLKLIYLDSPEANVLHKLTSFSMLQSLKIYKFNCSEIYHVLKRIGRQLRQLTCLKGRNIMDVGLVIQNCPNLRDLDFYMMDELTCLTDENFNQLQSFEILNSPMSSTVLRNLICNCHQTIRRLAVDRVPFTDYEMASILLDYNFNKLEDIWFTFASHLTMATIELLMDRLPELSSIGQLTGWNISNDEIFLLTAILKSGNSCLKLSPSNIFSS